MLNDYVSAIRLYPESVKTNMDKFSGLNEKHCHIDSGVWTSASQLITLVVV